MSSNYRLLKVRYLSLASLNRAPFADLFHMPVFERDEWFSGDLS